MNTATALEIESEGDFALHVEKLRSLQALSQLQVRCRRAECAVERCYEESEENRFLDGECRREVEKLEEERARLLRRVEAIDRDLELLHGLLPALARERAVSLHMAPLKSFEQLRAQVDTSRTALGLGPLPPSQAAIRTSQRLADEESFPLPSSSHSLSPPPPSQPRANRSSSGSDTTPLVVGGKSGPSYKLCPHCHCRVSRNASLCPHCTATCSKLRRKRQSSARETQ